MRSEVKVYDQYLRGDVWDVRIVEDDGTTRDACSGFYGQDCAIAEGTRMLAEGAADRREAFARAFAEEVQTSRPDLAPDEEMSP